MDAQLQREPDNERREVLELCTIYRGQPESPGACIDAASLSFQLSCLWTVGSYASPPARLSWLRGKGPRLKASKLMRPIQWPKGRCSLRHDSEPLSSASAANASRGSSSVPALSSRFRGSDFPVRTPNPRSNSTCRIRFPRPSLSFFIALL